MEEEVAQWISEWLLAKAMSDEPFDLEGTFKVLLKNTIRMRILPFSLRTRCTRTASWGFILVASEEPHSISEHFQNVELVFGQLRLHFL